MDQDVYFHVESPGYEYAQDYFHNRGVKLRTHPGSRAVVKLKRGQIAERLYRVTGAGIYRDSTLAGERTPLKQPLLNAQVLGQDTVIASRYRGKIYWFWGDTERVSYPLGNFGASGARSEFPGHGGLQPEAGVDLTYFTNADGFSKPMCPDSSFGPGLKWIEGLILLRANSREHLFARVAAGTGLSKTREWHLARFDDEREVFESIARWDIHDTHDSSHPFRANVQGVEYLYLYPNFRVRAETNQLKDLKNYEAFTCVAGDGRVRGKETTVDRDTNGRPRYTWKAGAERLDPGRTRQAVNDGWLKPTEAWCRLLDLETGGAVEGGRGSVFWNHYRRRWVMIVAGKAGEIWFSEADTPTGPWVYARRVATHGRYNFYNPTQHPFFDQDGGRVIYFEGTYTESFSGARSKTPRYDYNQIMYRLSLDDSRLALPVPVYRLAEGAGRKRHLLREGLDAEHAWNWIHGLAFFALAPNRLSPTQQELIPIWETADGAHFTTNAPSTGSGRASTPSASPLFFALPVSPSSGGSWTNTPATSEVLRGQDGQALGRVWQNPLTALPLDPDARPEAP
jgi:hypothetical protein